MRISTIGYSMKQGVKNIRRNKMFSVASIATMAACIFLFGLFYSIVVNFSYIVEKAEEGVAITVFFNEDATKEQKDTIGAQLKKEDGVLKVNYVSADEAWNKFKDQYFGESSDLAEGFKSDNPLANSDNYEVYLSDVSKQKDVVSYAKSLDGVRKVNKSDVVAKTLTSVNKLVGYVSVAIIAILLAVSIFLISNTVTMGITVRREEIAIMKYIGAKDGFVRAPFVIEGLIIGAVGAVIPLVLLYFMYDKAITYIMTKFSLLNNIVDFLPVATVYRTLLPIGIALGVGIGFVGKRKKMISLLLVLTLVSGMFVQTYATEIDDTKKKAEELESKKKAAENEKTSLADQLKKLTGEMEKTKKKISAKEDEITNKEEELILAKADENEQYESMKKRIRYMYENGNTGFVEILCSSKSIGELLNNAEYISRISGYDRNMLVEFQKVVTNVENQEAELKKEYKELQTMQDDLITKQDSVNELIKNKQSEIQSLTSELGDTKNKLAQLEAAAAEAERKQKEAAAAAAAAKKAQAAAKKNTSSSGSSAGSAGASVVSGNGTFTHPCPSGYISSGFGYRTQPIAGASTNHKGIDFAAATGTPIYAAAAGTVISAGYAGNAGNLLVISHGNGLLTYYMHCNAIYVSAGQKVSKGQNVAAVGTTGNSTGPHLHFQVMLNGTPVNPANYL